jgi:hypothetical protein
MYTLSVGANASAVIDAGSFNISKGASLQVSSSNAIQANITVQTGSWTVLPLNNVTSIVYISLYNDNAVYSSSTIWVSDTPSLAGVLCAIQPGLPALLPLSGSNTLYAACTSQSLAPFVGTLQYYAQQG